LFALFEDRTDVLRDVRHQQLDGIGADINDGATSGFHGGEPTHRSSLE
jgi:hypothetical protein